MRIYIIILSLCFCLFGCDKDQMDGKYNDLILPTISDNPDNDPAFLIERHTYRVRFEDTLQIKAAIDYPNADDLAYSWRINGEEVSTEKDLFWICDLRDRGAAALYVTRKSAGNATIFPFSIELDNPFERGWNIITDKDGKIVYHFVQEILGNPYRYLAFENALSTDKPADSWIKSMEYWSKESPAVKGHMLHLDADALNSFNLNQMTMAPTVGLHQEFIQDQLPTNFRIADAAYSGYIGFLKDVDGRLFFRKSQNGYYTGRFSNIPMQMNGDDVMVSSLMTGPNKLGIVLAYDKKAQKIIAFNTGYNDSSNKNAGQLVDLPQESDLSKFKADKIHYHRIIRPQYTYMTEHQLFMVHEGVDGAIRASEYTLDVISGVISVASKNYVNSSLPNYGNNSKIVALDNPGDGLTYVYYTDHANPRRLYACKRSPSGLTTPTLFHEFDAPVVSIDQGMISRTSKNIGLGFDNGTFMLIDLRVDMDTFVSPEQNADDNSVLFQWDNVGHILGVDFRYGGVGNY